MIKKTKKNIKYIKNDNLKNLNSTNTATYFYFHNGRFLGRWALKRDGGGCLETPVVDRLPIETQRTSRRVQGKNPSILDGNLKTAVVKKLLLGGLGG